MVVSYWKDRFFDGILIEKKCHEPLAFRKPLPVPISQMRWKKGITQPKEKMFSAFPIPEIDEPAEEIEPFLMWDFFRAPLPDCFLKVILILLIPIRKMPADAPA